MNWIVQALTPLSVPSLVCSPTPLALDPTLNFGRGGSNGQTVTTNTTSPLNTIAGDILICNISHERTVAQGSFANVTSVTVGAINLIKRISQQFLSAFEPQYMGQEIWWGYSATAQSDPVITVTTDVVTDAISFGVGGFTGFSGTSYQTNPWDTNGSLPAVATGDTVTVPGITGINTMSPQSMVLMFCHCGPNPGAATNGLTTYLVQGNGAGSHNCAAVAASGPFATVQSNLASSFTNVEAPWMVIGDALAGCY